VLSSNSRMKSVSRTPAISISVTLPGRRGRPGSFRQSDGAI
jgi:hypothetical protein